MISLRTPNARLLIDLPPPHTPLASLRSLIAHRTGLPPTAFKLIHAGALLNDDAAPISAYHLRPNSKLSLIPLAPQVLRPPSETSENAVLSLIHAELHSVRSNLSPDLNAFLINGVQKDHTRLGELLLQSLLRLDGIATEHYWDLARHERKAAVREVQDMLDRLDARWAEIQSAAL
ncbi:hypothetical protein APHAL10511_003676 [Amanita phalloides]|nr:hypothetical protein APHAL10511_003676 [Amanita phalloides]